MSALLTVRDLRTEFRTEDGIFAAVDGVDFELAAGEVLGIVGESGSGKSVTALSILGLIPSPPGRVARGEILFEGRDLLKLREREMRAVRGADISMIFQEPMTSLNPVFTIGDQIVETIRFHESVSVAAARARAVELLELVGIPSPRERLSEYPHQLSGGMRQRVMIAIALSCQPKLLLADEPTTALDVTIQAQILDLLRRLQAELGMAVIIITHDLGVVAEFAQRAIVMYAGKVVEHATVEELFERPLHPYTEGLLASLPVLDEDQNRLQAIPGVVPSPFDLPPGCRFSPRCQYARPPCLAGEPALMRRDGRDVACIRHQDYRLPGG
ncbi:MAG: ABC transporter ATP-binding protein [Ectothiorhodospiraceae bacterium]|nr:ABC transporter ATP-binding protein [Chromatiales bacterium]MCP5155997.1 ABC transporter ATP-binding protein [Ectothiorhodospiraceae bacterium]